MRILQETLAISTWIVMMVVFWACLKDMVPAWWLVTLVITSILFMFFYRTKDLLPISQEVHEVIMFVSAAILCALHMILLLSVVGVLPFSFTFNFQ